MTSPESWKVWNEDVNYGELFKKRANGSLPEMESSKAVAKHINNLIKINDSILDVGCGGGHYLKSLQRIIDISFNYTGIDATENYINIAKKIYGETNDIKFFVGDIYNLISENNTFDIVMCNNVFLHLPSIKKPLQELIRVSKKYIIIRTLVGSQSFRIQHITEPEKYSENGEPINYYYYNIYNINYISEILNNINEIKSYNFVEDNDYNINAFNIETLNYINKKPTNLTKIIDNKQVNNYIIQPWQFIIIEKY